MFHIARVDAKKCLEIICAVSRLVDATRERAYSE